MASIIRRSAISLSIFTIASYLLLACTACKKTTTCSGVPYVNVGFTVSLNSATSNQLQITGNSEAFTGGYNNNGVLIYHYTQNQFLAYDCTCPYDGQSNAKAIVLANPASSLYATCPVCGSTFLLSTGAPSKGPSACPLKTYTATYDNTSNEVYVTN